MTIGCTRFIIPAFTHSLHSSLQAAAFPLRGAVIYFDPNHSVSPAANRPRIVLARHKSHVPRRRRAVAVCSPCCRCSRREYAVSRSSRRHLNGDCRPSTALSGHGSAPAPKLRRSLKDREPEAPRAKRKSPSSSPQIQKVMECLTCRMLTAALLPRYRKTNGSLRSSTKDIAMNSPVSSFSPDHLCMAHKLLYPNV